MIVHCLFEQSGHFKNVLKEYGHQAYDYDILNNFNETDYQIDLFNEIDKGYERKPSIFDNIKKDDLTIAFFPCTRFSTRFQMNCQGHNSAFKKWSEIQKLEYNTKAVNEMAEYNERFNKLVGIYLRNGGGG